MNFAELIKELRKRSVIKIASIYAVSAAGIIQVLTATAPFLDIPDIVVTSVIILAIIFFPIAVFLSWKYEIVPEDQLVRKMEDEDEEIHEIHKKTLSWNQLVKILIPVIFGLGFMILVTVNWVKGQSVSIDQLKKEKIAVLEFANETGDSSLNYIGLVASNLISHALSLTGEIDLMVPTLEIGQNHTNVLYGKFGFSPNFVQHSGITNLIYGSYFRLGDSLFFNSQIIKASSGAILKTFDQQWTHIKNPLEGIESLRQHILGFWITKDNPFFDKKFPRADAYEEYLKAIKLWERDYDQALVHLDKCLEIDSGFVRANLLKGSIYSNTGRFEKLDSLLIFLESSELEMEECEHNVLNYLKADLAGNSKMAYDYFLKEYDRAPNDLFVNTAALTMALLFVNKPEDVIEFSKEIDYKLLDLNDCYYCRDRMSIHARALIDLGLYQEALELLKTLKSEPNDLVINALKLRALARMKDYQGLEEVIDEFKNERFTPGRDYIYFNYRAATEFALLKDKENASIYGSRVLELCCDTVSIQNYRIQGNVYLVIGQYDLAERFYKLAKPEHGVYLARLGMALGYQDKKNEALEIIDILTKQRSKYQGATADYFIAQIWASLGNKKNTIESLRKSLSQGKRFYFYQFQNDPVFIDLFDHPEFKDLLDIS